MDLAYGEHSDILQENQTDTGAPGGSDQGEAEHRGDPHRGEANLPGNLRSKPGRKKRGPPMTGSRLSKRRKSQAEAPREDEEDNGVEVAEGELISLASGVEDVDEGVSEDSLLGNGEDQA